jgi:NAD(P)-dependent dehydrogenase (short-subunit alcohol dehydrogenase family)
MKNYIVVGGTSGIGRAIVEGLLSQGNAVHVLSREERGIASLPNVTFESWDALKEDIPTTWDEELHGLVYCPGTISLKPFHRISSADFLHEMNVNAFGAARILQHYYDALKKENDRSVVLFSTVAVQTGMPFHSSIAMAKGAVEGLTRSLAAEWAPKIRVNCVAPSLTITPLSERLTSTPEKIEASAKRHPLQSIGTAEDIANAALFLLSDQSRWMTGQVMHVDGGMSSLRP